MVEAQIAARGVRDARVLAAMERIPREAFLPPEDAGRAYEDRAIPIGAGQTISQPYMVARMTEELRLAGRERVLEVGTGSGYQTAVLAELAADVFTVERIACSSDRSREVLAALGYAHIRFRVGDGSLGWAEHAPFDRILVTAGAPDLPPSLVTQLAPGGILVVPVGDERSQVLVSASRGPDGRLLKAQSTPCSFVRLVGREGWSAER